jgi:hypothetical protein
LRPQANAAVAEKLPQARRKGDAMMESIIASVTERGDLAHLALFLWAAGASAALMHALKELAAASRRFDDFVRELARFNARHR